jgi:hydrogenase nickel incorporation protein HypA/HybF
MHEMAVTQALLDMALDHADGRRVTDVYIQVGRMSAIVPGSVEVFFKYLSEDTPAEGARLHFEILPIEVTCQDCDRPVDLSEWTDNAPHTVLQKAFARGCECGSKNLRVTGGVSFGLTSIDVDPDLTD